VRSGRLIPRKPGEVEAYIVGGERVTTGFGAVGALMMDADLDCTGTLVGPVTVLTAAHCVYGREGELPNMSFALGSYAFQPDTSRAVDAFVYPQGENGYRYVDSSLADDIALVYLKDTFPGITPHKLASKTPGVDALAAAKAHPDFVGFGFAMVENSPVGLGYKRHAVIGLGPVEPKRFWYGDPGKNTCNGDSGGPAFVSDETTLSVIGVTSGGAAGCDSGAVDTRVDAYLDWLTPRLR
jgi:secreted trypsin-like serine protease